MLHTPWLLQLFGWQTAFLQSSPVHSFRHSHRPVWPLQMPFVPQSSGHRKWEQSSPSNDFQHWQIPFFSLQIPCPEQSFGQVFTEMGFPIYARTLIGWRHVSLNSIEKPAWTVCSGPSRPTKTMSITALSMLWAFIWASFELARDTGPSRETFAPSLDAFSMKAFWGTLFIISKNH